LKQSFDDLQKKLSRWSRKFPDATIRAYDKAAPGLKSLIRDNYLSGQVLGVRTGNLKKSITEIINRLPKRAQMLIGTAVKSDKGFGYGAYWFYKGRDFLNPAIRKDLSRITQLVADEVMAAYPKEAV